MPLTDDWNPDDILGSIRKKGLFTLPWTTPEAVDPGFSPPIMSDAPDRHNLDGLPSARSGPDVNDGTPSPHPDDMRIEAPTRAKGALSDMVGAASSAPSIESDMMGAAHPGTRIPFDQTHLNEMEDKLHEMQQPLGWKRKLLNAGLMVLPVAAGAAFGGGRGAAVAADAVGGYMGQKGKNKTHLMDQLNTDIENERGRMNTSNIAQDRTEAAEGYNDARIRNLESQVGARGEIKPGSTLKIVGADGKPHVVVYDPNAGGYVDKGEAAPTGTGNINYSPLVDTAGNINGRWNPRQGAPEPLPAPNPSAPVSLTDKVKPAASPFRKSPVPPPTLTPLVNPTGEVDSTFNNRSGAIAPTKNATGARKAGVPGAIENRDVQGRSIEIANDNLNKMIDANKKNLGPVIGRYKNFEAMMGSVDPQTAELRAAIMSYIALQPGMHQFRGMTAVKEFEKQVGGIKMTPEGLKAALKGTTEGGAGVIRQAIDEKYHTGTGAGQPTAPATGAADYIYARDPQGQLHRAPKGTALKPGWKLENK